MIICAFENSPSIPSFLVTKIVYIGQELNNFERHGNNTVWLCFIMVLEILSRPGDFLFFSFNYRGITITSSVGKVFNSILNERLDSFLKQNNIIDDP
jgi:hypothetical protein